MTVDQTAYDALLDRVTKLEQLSALVNPTTHRLSLDVMPVLNDYPDQTVALTALIDARVKAVLAAPTAATTTPVTTTVTPTPAPAPAVNAELLTNAVFAAPFTVSGTAQQVQSVQLVKDTSYTIIVTTSNTKDGGIDLPIIMVPKLTALYQFAFSANNGSGTFNKVSLKKTV
jgi:hypothetical protein